MFLPGKSHGQRSLEDCSPWGRKVLDTTEQSTPGRAQAQVSLDWHHRCWRRGQDRGEQRGEARAGQHSCGRNQEAPEPGRQGPGDRRRAGQWARDREGLPARNLGGKQLWAAFQGLRPPRPSHRSPACWGGLLLPCHSAAHGCSSSSEAANWTGRPPAPPEPSPSALPGRQGDAPLSRPQEHLAELAGTQGSARAPGGGRGRGSPTGWSPPLWVPKSPHCPELPRGAVSPC